MLRIWLSTDRKKNTARIFDEICRKEHENQILLVPEQFSHMAERELCRLGGDSICRYAEVLSFSRLANRVFSALGGGAQTQTDPAGKLMIMSLAVEQVRSRLKLYGAGGEKPEFLLKIIETLEELQSFCITAQMLREAAVNVGGVLAVKAEELALLMESYESVCANLGQNPESCLTRLLHALDGSDFADGKRIYIDAFTDFNGIEREIIAELLNGGAEVTVALHCDDIHGSSQQFAAARQAAKELLRAAGKQNLEAKISVTEAEISWQHKLFGGENTPCVTDSVVFIDAASAVDECRIAAGEILKLVEQGARFRDITIACGDYTYYRNILQSVLRRAKIPAYYAGDTDILQQSVIHMLLTALQAATGGMETEAVLSYLKSGFLRISRERCDRLENYVLMWNIQGKTWEEAWSKNPFGISKEETELSRERLAQLNYDRENYILPLVRLQKALKASANTAQMLVALTHFMEQIELNERLNYMAQKLCEQGQLQTAQEYAQVYAIICGLLEQMYGVLGTTVRTPEMFYQMIRSALSQCSIGTIPANLDSVSIGNLLSQRRNDCKYVFLLGANEGSFPSAQSNQTLLTDLDRMGLMNYGLGITPVTTCSLEREIAAIAGVLEAPCERLYFGCVRGQESYYYLRARKLFDEAESLTSDHALITRSERDYLNYLLTDPDYAENAPAMREEAVKLLDAQNHDTGSLSEETVKELYGDVLQLSSSKIDKLAMCRMGYFLQYGLKAQERKPARIDASVFGTFVHDILEHVSKQVMKEGGFHEVSLERTMELANERMQWYMREKLAELWDSERSEYLFVRSFGEVRSVVEQLWKELSVSEFAPEWFELTFGNGEHMSAVKIVGEKMAAELSGKVDRADIWRNGDRIYVRIVDYKTGKTSLELGKIRQGIGLQMLLYLFAMYRNGAHLLDHPLDCAGVLYFSAKVERLSVDYKLDPSIDKQRKKSERRSGLILNHENVLQAMEPQDCYMPDENSRVTKEQFEQLEDFVFKTVGALADELAMGKVEANPYYVGDRDNACAKCSYQEVCRDSAPKRWIPSVKKLEEFFDDIQEVSENG